MIGLGSEKKSFVVTKSLKELGLAIINTVLKYLSRIGVGISQSIGNHTFPIISKSTQMSYVT